MIGEGDFGNADGLGVEYNAVALIQEATDILTGQGRDSLRRKQYYANKEDQPKRFVNFSELPDVIDNVFDGPMWGNPQYPNWQTFRYNINAAKAKNKEYIEAVNRQVKLNDDLGMSRGGSVRAEYSPERINLMAQEILADDYAEGGLVTYNPERINRMAELILQEA